jgi:hypothetical protein
VIRDGQNVKVTTTIDLTNISSASPDVITIYTGFYWWYSKDRSYTSAGWRINYSGNSWTARYSPGGSLPGGVFMGYTARAVKIPIIDLFTSAADKAAADKAAADKAAADKAAADDAAAVFKAAADARAAAIKKVTITCTKGKLTKKIKAVKPKCPTGYKKK